MSPRPAAAIGPAGAARGSRPTPGAKVKDVDGNKRVCGPDGQWFRDYATFTSTGTRGTRAAVGAGVSGTLLR